MPTAVAEIVCPRCGHALITAEKGPSWCPDCEWNLEELGATLDDVPRTWRWLVRRCHRSAFRLDGELFEKYSASRPQKQETSIAGALGMVRAWPATEARVAPDAERMKAVDRELLDWYKAAHQSILGTRVFRRSN
jgi:hypothetical protein